MQKMKLVSMTPASANWKIKTATNKLIDFKFFGVLDDGNIVPVQLRQGHLIPEPLSDADHFVCLDSTQ